MWKIDPKINLYKKQAGAYTNSDAEHVCSSGTTVGTQGKKERKRK
jgi:hypothetical protein